MQSYVMTHDTDNESDIDQSYQQMATDSESQTQNLTDSLNQDDYDDENDLNQ